MIVNVKRFEPPANTPAGQQAAAGGLQYLEDLATAYWYSEALFAALELEIFFYLEENPYLSDLASAAACKAPELERLLQTMAGLGLVAKMGNAWRNSETAHRYLVKGGPEYSGDFLLYRRYLQGSWQSLAARVSTRELPEALDQGDDYGKRTFFYVRAMDALARQKAAEISLRLAQFVWRMPILDIGGGAAALSRHLLQGRASGRAVLLELPEVLAAARQLYPAPVYWEGLEDRPGDFRDCELNERFGLILMGNFLHIYDPEEARRLLAKAAGLLLPGGLLVVHDYLPDRPSPHSLKGLFYDLNMMLNTYKGRCHCSSEVIDWLSAAGLKYCEVMDLETDSGIIVARGREE